jgi:hypothetical protein
MQQTRNFFCINHKTKIMIPKSLLPCLALFVCIGCQNDDNQPVDEVALKIAEVRMATAAFVNHNAAVEAGWNNALSPCVEHPTEGGMGIHYGRMEYFDGRVNHLEPQVLLYLPDGTGGMEFLGVEYIVPFAILPPTSPAPVLFGHHFHQNHEQEIWALHVWTERDNPSGMFHDWNPTVSCGD